MKREERPFMKASLVSSAQYSYAVAAPKVHSLASAFNVCAYALTDSPGCWWRLHQMFSKALQMFLWMVYIYNFLTKWNTVPWCVAKCLTEGCWWYLETSECLTEGWWWYSETSEITVLCGKQAPRHIRSVLYCSKNTISCLFHANVSLSIVEQIHTD